MIGMWKSFVKAGLKGSTVPNYMVLNSDGTFILGIDSLDSDPMKSSSGGVWSVTEEGEIKIYFFGCIIGDPILQTLRQ